MKLSKRWAFHGLAAALAIGLAGQAAAAPVAFRVGSFAFQPGSGYGPGNLRLGVEFESESGFQNFGLNVNESKTFKFGKVKFDESNSAIGAPETDNLGVSAFFNFESPLDADKTVQATGTAKLGPIKDPDVDLVIDWSDITVSSASGLFSISMNDLSFTKNGQELDQYVTIKLLSTGLSQLPGNRVPEPASLALVAGGLLAAGLSTRRRRAA